MVKQQFKAKISIFLREKRIFDVQKRILINRKIISAFSKGVVSTPSPAAGYGQSPASNHPYNTPSSGYSPNMPYNPQTPGAGLDIPSISEWHTVDIEVSQI